jgi:hypothetical protein
MRSGRARLIQLTLVSGTCRWCGCTQERACAAGCSWANADQTLCSECVELERAMRTPRGRAALADFLQEHDFQRYA